MKTLSLSIFAAAAACGFASAQTAFTTPVGYTTQNTVAGQFNLIGLGVQNPTIAAGDFELVSGTSLTDNDVNFTTLLTAGSTYVLEITSGSGDGIIQEITSWTGSVLTTPQNISGSVTPDSTTYRLRLASTVASVFGATNQAGLKAGSSTTADIVWIPNASGSFDQIYRATAAFPLTAGWKRIGSGNTDFSNLPMVYADSFIIQRRGDSTLPALVTAGEVKIGKSSNAVTGSNSFNYLGTVFPVGTTLANSGLTDFVLRGSSTAADVVWIPDGAGSYLQYYYANAAFPLTAGWKRIGTGNTDQSNVPLTPGIILQRRGASATVTFTPPASYSSL